MLSITDISKHFDDTYADSHYLRNDAVHRQNHFVEVAQAGHAINEALGLQVPAHPIEIVAWVHDLYAFQRETHHLDSAAWVLDTQDVVISALSWEEKQAVSRTCAEHRASYKGHYSSTLSELMASVDRGFASPGDVLTRAYQYALAQVGNQEEAVTQAVEHLIEKFGRDGYQKLPVMYSSFYAGHLEARYVFIDRLPTLTPSEVKGLLVI